MPPRRARRPGSVEGGHPLAPDRVPTPGGGAERPEVHVRAASGTAVRLRAVRWASYPKIAPPSLFATTSATAGPRARSRAARPRRAGTTGRRATRTSGRCPAPPRRARWRRARRSRWRPGSPRPESLARRHRVVEIPDRHRVPDERGAALGHGRGQVARDPQLVHSSVAIEHLVRAPDVPRVSASGQSPASQRAPVARRAGSAPPRARSGSALHARVARPSGIGLQVERVHDDQLSGGRRRTAASPASWAWRRPAGSPPAGGARATRRREQRVAGRQRLTRAAARPTWVRPARPPEPLGEIPHRRPAGSTSDPPLTTRPRTPDDSRPRASTSAADGSGFGPAGYRTRSRSGPLDGLPRRDERFLERAVDVHGPGLRAAARRDRLAPGPPPRERVGRGRGHGRLEVRPRVRAEQPHLVDRLVRAGAAQTRGTVGGQQEEGHARLRGLDHCGEQLGRRRAARARDGDGTAARLREPQREERARRSSRWTWTSMPGGARTRARAVSNATPGRGTRDACRRGELVDQGAAHAREMSPVPIIPARCSPRRAVRQDQARRQEQAARRVRRGRTGQYRDQFAPGRRAHALHRPDREHPREQSEQAPTA